MNDNMNSSEKLKTLIMTSDSLSNAEKVALIEYLFSLEELKKQANDNDGIHWALRGPFDTPNIKPLKFYEFPNYPTITCDASKKYQDE
jgi:hypothetical protein